MSTSDYTLSKGRIWLKLAGEAFYRDFGNTPDFKITIETENVEHFSGKGPNKNKDWEHLNSYRVKWAATAEELSVENMKLFFASDSTEDIVQTGATVSAEAIADVEPFRGYKLAYHSLENVVPSSVVVKKGLTTFIEGTDYEVDYKEGILYILGGAIVSGDDITVDYKALTVTTGTYTQINGSSRSNYEGDIIFVGNPGAGHKLTVKGYVSIMPSGDVALIGDDLVKLQLGGEFLVGHGYGKDNAGLFEVLDRGKVT